MAASVSGAVAILFLSFSLTACAGAKRAARPGEPSTVAALPAPVESGEPNGGRAPAFSPDGTRIAFLSSTPHTPPDLWMMNADGSGKRRLTTRGVSSFRWASDGRTIHVQVRRKGYEEVLSVDPERPGMEERVPGLPPNAGLPIFSPDGTLFAFTSPGADGIRDLWVGTADRSRVEAVTEKIFIRSFFWGPDGRKIYYEPGKTYGLGLWVIDLSTMEVKPILSKYIGTPEFSAKAGRVALPYPTNPGEFEVRTMNLDGTDVVARKAPRLGERWVAWAADGAAVYYTGPDVSAPAGKAAETKPPAEPSGEAGSAARKPEKGSKAATPAKKKQKDKPERRRDRQGRRGARVAHATAASGSNAPTPIAPHGMGKRGESRDATNALWRLDLATGTEQRVSPAELHVLDVGISPDGKTALVTGLLTDSRGPEIFRLDLATGEATRLATSRRSEWMPVPSPDATRVAYATNEGALDALRVADLAGAEIAAYPGFVLEAGAKVFWLPRSEGLLVFSQRGLHAFSEKGPVAFAGAKDHQALLDADVSIQDDKVALISIPKYGETPGLYLLEARDGAFAQTDLRYPAPPEPAADRYLHPRWSSDGKRIAFTDGIDVWTTNADGTGRRRLTTYAEANSEKKGPPSVASFPVWSVGGGRLAYTLTVYAPKSVLRELWLVEADGSSPRRLFSEEVDSQLQVFLPEYTSAPFFDPSDRHLIATVIHRGLPNVASIDVVEGRATPLTETGAVFPAMLPEEDSILYTSLQGNDERIWIMNADGTGKRPFLKAGSGAGGTGGERAPTR